MATLRFTTTVLCMLASASAIADLAPLQLHSGVSPETRPCVDACAHRATVVVMEAETVNVRLVNTGRVEFDLQFTFLNPTDTAEDLEVGFPTGYEDEIKDLVVTIDGTAVKATYSLQIEGFHLSGPKRNFPRKGGTEHWLSWHMNFPPESRRIVEMEYWVAPDSVEDSPFDTDFGSFFEEDFPDEESSKDVLAILAGNAHIADSGYILTTGEGWAGPIGKAVITVAHVDKGVLRSFYPKTNYTLIENVLTWTFEDFEPSFDLYFEFSDQDTFDQEIRQVEKALEVAGRRYSLLWFLEDRFSLKYKRDPRRVAILHELIDLAEQRTWCSEDGDVGNELIASFFVPGPGLYKRLLEVLPPSDTKARAALQTRAVRQLELALQQSEDCYDGQRKLIKESVDKALPEINADE